MSKIFWGFGDKLEKMPIEDIEHVKAEIARIFWDSDVEHFQKSDGRNSYELFENHEAVYSACHISNENHGREDFWHAIAMMRAQRATIAVCYHKENESDETIDFIVDKTALGKEKQETIAAKLFYMMMDGEKYLALVRVPFDYQNVRFEEMKKKNSRRLKVIRDHKELATEMAIRIAALMRHDWGIEKVDYSQAPAEPVGYTPAE